MAWKSDQTALAIGEKLHAAREREKKSLRELAAQAEISASMLSQIENGKVFPSVRSMYNIAAALNVPVDYFFPDTQEPAERTLPLEQMTASEIREAKLTGTLDPDVLGFDGSSPPPSAPVVHRAMRPVIQLKGGVTWARLTAQPEPGAEFLEITYAPGATSGAMLSHHMGREFGLVLDGELMVELAFERYALKPGDSIIFDSTTPHRLTNTGAAPMHALWVVLNPLPK